MGSRDTKITFMRPGVVDDGLASRKGAMADLHQTWAGLKDVSDAERLAAGQVEGVMITRFVVGWTTANATVTPADVIRVRVDGVEVYYGITGVKRIGARDRLEITAQTRPAP
jgi:head-tail adaptor